MTIQLHASMAVHPGPWLKRNVVDHYDLSVTFVAERLGVSRPAMSNLLNGKADLSPDMAIRFEKAFGIPADTMLRMQSAHDLTDARQHEDDINVERVEFATAA
jgi:addiction module HigA family antidote